MGILLGAILMVVSGHDPIAGYYYMFIGGFGSLPSFLETLAYATPLMLTAACFSVGAKAGIFNVGAEGGAYLGALGAAAVAGGIALPAGLHLAAATAAGMFFGVVWTIPVAVLKIWRGVHEVITTIMLNWVAHFFVIYTVLYILRYPGYVVRTAPALPTARYSVLIGEATLTTVIFVAIAFCILTYVLLWRTRLGYELRLVGSNPDAARYAGVSIRRAVFFSLVFGGMAAGLAGASQVIGRPPVWALSSTLAEVMMLGYNGIGVALIGRNHPIGGIFAAVLIGGMMNGGLFMNYMTRIRPEIVQAILGLIILALALPELLEIIRRKSR